MPSRKIMMAEESKRTPDAFEFARSFEASGECGVRKESRVRCFQSVVMAEGMTP